MSMTKDLHMIVDRAKTDAPTDRQTLATIIQSGQVCWEITHSLV